MHARAVSTLYQSNIRTIATKASKHVNNFRPLKPSAPELASLPPAPHLRSLQRLRAKRGTIKPILNNERIEPRALVDPTHPVSVDPKSFQAPYSSNDYFNAKAYPNVMLKRLGVRVLPSGGLRPLPPPEPEFPIFKRKKRVKLARVYIMPIKSTHKSAVVRVRLKRKLNEAIQLVVTRGADAGPKEENIVFNPSDALESKWLLRDWYYVFYPRIPLYHAPWPALVKSVRRALAAIVEKGMGMRMEWNLSIADREAKAMDKLSRREMRRVRMWRRQDQEAVERGGIAQDVGMRWKPKGTGIKKRRVLKQARIGNGKVKVLRAPTRKNFQPEIRPRQGGIVSKQEPHSLKTKLIAAQPDMPQSKTTKPMPPEAPRVPQVPQRGESEVSGTRTRPPESNSAAAIGETPPKRLRASLFSSKPVILRPPTSKSAPPKPSNKSPNRISTKPPSTSPLRSLQKPHSSGSTPHSVPVGARSPNENPQGSSSGKGRS